MLASSVTSFAVAFLVRLIGDLWTKWRAEEEAKAAGRAEAVAESRAAAAVSTAEARTIEADADRRHAADASDAAFDHDFKRS